MSEAPRRYAPMDWVHTRPHGLMTAKSTEEQTAAAYPYLNTNRANPFESALLEYSFHAQRINPMDTVMRRPDADWWLRWEIAMIMAMGRWHRAGRNVFRYDAYMTTNLDLLDLAQARVDDLSDLGDVDPQGVVLHPYKTYYLAFDGFDFTLPCGRKLDGVLVTRSMAAPKGEGRMSDEQEEILRRALELEEQGRSEEARALVPRFKEIHAERMVHPILDLVLMPVPDKGHWTTRSDRGYVAQVDLVPGENLADAFERAKAEDLENIREDVGAQRAGHAMWGQPPGFPRVLKLVLNAILYTSRYCPAPPSAWQPHALDKLVAAADRRPAAARQLEERGFVRTKLVSFGRGHDLPEAAGGGVRPHWRRAHWAIQVHGRGDQFRKLRKLIIRQETKVAWHEGDAEPVPMLREYSEQRRH